LAFGGINEKRSLFQAKGQRPNHRLLLFNKIQGGVFFLSWIEIESRKLLQNGKELQHKGGMFWEEKLEFSNLVRVWPN